MSIHAPRIVLVLAAFVLSPATATGVAEEVRVIVDAGRIDRRAAPVAAEIAVPAGTQSAVVVAGGKETAAQVEPLAGGRARVWWIVGDLAAGQRLECVIRPGAAAAAPSFAWKGSSGEHGKSTDLVLGDRPVLRYMHTAFDPADIELTKKPFHHVFSPDGSRLITKGPGGLYPHHRGIYLGYKCKVGDGVYDTWHCHKGEHQVHVDKRREWQGPVAGGHEVVIHWNDTKSRTFLEERRALWAWSQPAGRLLIDFDATLAAAGDPVELGGDRQHAGVQFRAAQAVADNQKATRWLRPEKWADRPADKEVNDAGHRGLPWNALQATIDGKRFTIVYMSHPGNPKDAEFSERLYGRFGEFAPWSLTADKPLRLRYRFWIVEGDDVSREEIERQYADYATPAAVTAVTAGG